MIGDVPDDKEGRSIRLRQDVVQIASDLGGGEHLGRDVARNASTEKKSETTP